MCPCYHRKVYPTARLVFDIKVEILESAIE